jgi:membrane protein
MAATSPWSFGGLTFIELGKRVWSEIDSDDVFGRAAQLAYYFLLALFPLLLFLVSILGIIAGDNPAMREDMFRYLGTVLPGDAAQLVSSTVNETITKSGGGKISFGILAALWAASNGMGAICNSLNVAYGVKETRPFWKTRLTAVLLTIALAVLIITALVGVLYGHDIAEVIAGKFGLGAAFEWTWKIVQWPIILAFVLLAFGLIYYFAPNVENASWQWVSPGAAMGVGLWLLVSFGFSLYLSYFNSYNATYGSLGAVIILMLWFYLTGAAILIGGEINSEIEHAAAEAGAPDAKQQGEKKPDEKAAPKQKTSSNSNLVASKNSAAISDTSRASRSDSIHPSQTHAKSSRSRRRRTPREPLTLRKVVVVAGAWVMGRLTGSRR